MFLEVKVSNSTGRSSKSEVRTSVICVINNVTYDFISSKTLENLALTESIIDFFSQYLTYHKYETEWKDIRYGNKIPVPLVRRPYGNELVTSNHNYNHDFTSVHHQKTQFELKLNSKEIKVPFSFHFWSSLFLIFSKQEESWRWIYGDRTRRWFNATILRSEKDFFKINLSFIAFFKKQISRV